MRLIIALGNNVNSTVIPVDSISTLFAFRADQK